MNANSVIFLLAFCAIFSIEELHAQDAQNTNHPEPKKSQVEQSELDRQPFQGPKYSSNGKLFFKEVLGFVARVDLNEVDGLFIGNEQLNDPGTLTDEQKNLIWFRISEELPEGTNFALRVSSINNNRHAGIILGIENVENNFNLEKNDFVLLFAGDPHQYNKKPRLNRNWVDFEKWNKESGYVAAKNKFNSRYTTHVTVAFLMQELIDESGNPNEEAYHKLLVDVGLSPKRARKLVALPNGQRALSSAVGLEVLDKLYNDPRVLNIVPFLKN